MDLLCSRVMARFAMIIIVRSDIVELGRYLSFCLFQSLNKLSPVCHISHNLVLSVEHTHSVVTVQSASSHTDILKHNNYYYFITQWGSTVSRFGMSFQLKCKCV